MELFHCRVSEFIHRVVFYHRDAAVRSWRNWILEGPFLKSG